MLSRLDFRASGSDEEPPSRVRVRGFADVAAANALVDAFAAALSLAATGNDDAAARAATAAATALRRAADPAVAANVAAGAVPDFAAVSAAGAAIERAVVSRAPAAVNLAAALVAAAPAHAARALALVAEETRRGMDDAARAALLPVVRAALERHVAEASGTGTGTKTGTGTGTGIRTGTKTKTGTKTRLSAVSRDAEVTAAAFHGATRAYFVSGKVPGARDRSRRSECTPPRRSPLPTPSRRARAPRETR